MKTDKSLIAAAIVFAIAGATPVLAQGNGRGRGHNKGDNADSDNQNVSYYRDDDRAAMHDWYVGHEDHLPPGLAKKDRLPPGLEKQLVAWGQLPPGLQKKIQPAPVEIVRRLPPPPPDCQNVVIGGNIVLLNRKTNIVVDIFHFEL
jgi:hypothetical protein